MDCQEKYANLKVCCPNESMGCIWKGLFKDVDEHSSYCEKQLLRKAVIDIQRLEARLEQKDREIYSIRNDFEIKIHSFYKEWNRKKKESFEKTKSNLEEVYDTLKGQIGELQAESTQKKEEFGMLKNQVKKLNKMGQGLKHENKDLKEEVRQLKNEIDRIKNGVHEKEISKSDNARKSDLRTQLFSQIAQHRIPEFDVQKAYLDIGIDDKHVGRIVIDLFFDKAPETCIKFVKLCTHENGIGYKGSKIVRINSTMCFMGEEQNLTYPLSGSGEFPAYLETPIENETGLHNRKRLITMHNEYGFTKSFFRIMLDSRPDYDGKHVIIGRVSKDTWHIVEQFIKVPTDDFRCPKHTISILDCGLLT